MATGPKLAREPLEILENDGTRQPPFLSQIWGPAVCGTLGFISVIVGNWTTKRPYFSGIQKHIAAAVVGAGIGQILEHYRSLYYADKDAVLRHYVQLHPEDFPAYEAQKFSDLFEPWIPIR